MRGGEKIKLPKIALIADVQNWAFHDHAKQISKHLKDSYDFQIFFYGEYQDIETLLLEIRGFDLIHFFWRGALFNFLNSQLHYKNSQNRKHLDLITTTIIEANITTSISDHLFLSQKEMSEQSVIFSALSIGYITISRKLQSIYSLIPNYPPPDCVIENGVDLNSFFPVDPERFYKEKDEIIVGWSGNSRWGDDDIDHKGLETIIKPVVEELRAEGYKVRGEYADRNIRWLLHGEMNDYYNSIDIYVCASDAEGGPSPVLESMACGLPVISTNVGIVADVFGNYQKEYILQSRNKEELKKKLIDLIENSKKRELLSKENLQSIKNFSWEKQCQKWDEFFKAMLFYSEPGPAKERRDFLRKQSLEFYLEQINSESKFNGLQDELQNSQIRVNELDKYSEELRGELQKFQTQIAEQSKYAAEQNKQVESLQSETEKSQAQILQQNSFIETLENELQQFTRKNEELQIRLTEIYEEAKITKSELAKAAEDLLMAKDIILKMEASRFWKIRNQWFKVKKILSTNTSEVNESQIVEGDSPSEEVKTINLNFLETTSNTSIPAQSKKRRFLDANPNNLAIETLGRLPKIALVADVPNWAFHNYAKQISKHLKDEYEFKIFFYGEYPEIETLMLEVKDYDLIHFFWRDALFSYLGSQLQHSFVQKGLDYFDFVTNFLSQANISTSIYDHLFLTEPEIEKRRILYDALSIGYTTVSKRLEKIYSSISVYPKPFGAVEDGVDLDFFVPRNLERLSDENKEIIIGWVGNSKWGGDGIDHKGIETIIKPVVEELRAEGYRVRGEYADRHVKWTPHEEMNDYYNTIDIYVCASDIEGTPNPALESMACGLPVISTDVGMIPQLFGPLQQQYILPSRTAEHLKIKLIELIENPQKRVALSQENLESIKSFSWEKQCQKWDEFFKHMLFISREKSLKQRSNYMRKQVLSSYLIATSDEVIKDISEIEKETLNHQQKVLHYEEIKKAVGQLQTKISLIEQSKFWKVRNQWFKVKKKAGLTKNQH